MNRVDIGFFYDLGEATRAISKTSGEWRFSIGDPDSYHLFSRARDLLKQLVGATELPLSLSKSKGSELAESIQEVIDSWLSSWTHDEENGRALEAPDMEVSEYHVGEIRRRASEFETVLLAELETFAAYSIEQRGIYSIPDLVEHAEKIIRESLGSKIPTEALQDIQQAGRCLAFELETASGFHILRALESVLHKYYVLVTKAEVHDRLPNWGAYIQALKKANDGNETIVTARLQQIKDTYRNKIMHPEIVLSPEDADCLFGTATSLIMEMAQHLT